MLELEAQFQTALEPIVVEFEALRAELTAVLRGAQAARDELDALRSELITVSGEIEAMRGRLDAPAWAAGVYRQGAVVQHFHGQYFKAAHDTAAEPGDGVAWRRLGLHGFRYRGLYIDGAEYETGDLVARDGSMLLQTAGTLTWLAIRGKAGKRGPPGKDGTGA